MKLITIESTNLAHAWEVGIERCLNEGVEFSTQYDKEGDPPSKDCTMVLHITKPFAEPRYHLGIPASLEDLEKYTQEVIYGVHDYWMDDQTNPNRWTYTYHQRLFRYGPISMPIDIYSHRDYSYNQIDQIVRQLKECPYTRRAQAITWEPWDDPDHIDPPCLQSLWFRIENNKLNMNVRFRSNDLFKAAFMNMIALTELQKTIANKLDVEIGEYLHISDSMHIYGKDIKDVEKMLVLINNRKFDKRVFTTLQCAYSFSEGCKQLLEEENMPQDKRTLVEQRLKYWEKLML